MDAKLKAEELIDKFMPHSSGNSNNNEAKQCALIAVDEIIRLDIFDCNDGWSDEDGDTKEYWQKVKQEIENL